MTRPEALSATRQGQRRASAIGAVAILLWSGLALLTTETGGIPPFELLALSFAIAAASGLALLFARAPGGAIAMLRQPGAAWLLGFAGLFLYHALYFLALKSAPPAEASLINYLWPLLIVLFASIGHGVRARHVLGAVLGLAGTALLLRPGASGIAIGRGEVAAAAAAVVWAGYSVLNRRFAAVPSGLIAWVSALVALAALACHLALERSVMPAPGQWAAIAALGIGPVGLAFYAWDHATKHGDLGLLGALAYATPLASTLWLILAGKAAADARLVLAAGLIVAGAAAAGLRRG